jgi:hypothetical protein
MEFKDIIHEYLRNYIGLEGVLEKKNYIWKGEPKP